MLWKAAIFVVVGSDVYFSLGRNWEARQNRESQTGDCS